MPLQNRVTPSGDLVAEKARGLLMGNRGGRFHNQDRTLGPRRWVSRAWICCLIEFKGRRRAVWKTSYTELFFVDEVTALAAGHRPCFECRRRDAVEFASCWAAPLGFAARSLAADMDRILHDERLVGRAKRRHLLAIDNLPDGAMFNFAGDHSRTFAVRDDLILEWRPAGYSEASPRPRQMMVDVLTPPGILAVLAGGYRPQWHPSAVVARSRVSSGVPDASIS
jgi:hypothetical protein